MACVPALGLAWWSHRKALLSASGAGAAWAVGAGIFASSLTATTILLVFFFSSALIAKFARASRADSPLVQEQSRPRGAHQVLAVGACPALAALFAAFTGDVRWLWGALCALGFATADTWATDWGQTYPGRPRRLGFGPEVTPGQSGGVTLRGTLAGLAGASLIAGLSAVFLRGDPRAWLLVAGTGWGGMFLDSLLGATLQRRGTCTVCGAVTERREHCGQRASRNHGGLSNEAVNLVCSGTCMWLGRLFSG